MCHWPPSPCRRREGVKRGRNGYRPGYPGLPACHWPPSPCRSREGGQRARKYGPGDPGLHLSFAAFTLSKSGRGSRGKKIRTWWSGSAMVSLTTFTLSQLGKGSRRKTTWSGLHIVKPGKRSRAVKNIDRMVWNLGSVRDSENTGLVIQAQLYVIGHLRVIAKRGIESRMKKI